MSEVSVIIPAYNQGHYLAAAIQSALDQTQANVEVLVIDDGSTDDTAQVAQQFTDPRVRYIHQANRGLSGARNTGIRHASGDFLTYLDSDDLFLPRKLELLLGELRARPQLGFVAGQAIPVDETGQPIGKLFDQALPANPTHLLLGNPLHVGSVLLRREWQARVGFFDETLRSYEDWDMWLRLALAGCQMGYVAQPVSLYRFHREQMTRDGRQMTTATFAVLDNFFARPDLPPTWQDMKARAYSRAHLRAAAQAYRVIAAIPEAKTHLQKAVELEPTLMLDYAEPLARVFAGWLELPKHEDGLAYLERIYTHLPPELAMLAQRRAQKVGETAVQHAFTAYTAADLTRARRAIYRAIRYQPRYLFNRGVLAMLARTHLALLRPAPAAKAS